MFLNRTLLFKGGGQNTILTFINIFIRPPLFCNYFGFKDLLMSSNLLLVSSSGKGDSM
jgi:hypothetical protein